MYTLVPTSGGYPQPWTVMKRRAGGEVLVSAAVYSTSTWSHMFADIIEFRYWIYIMSKILDTKNEYIGWTQHYNTW